MNHTVLWWVLFNLFVMAMLMLDLFVFHKKAHEVKMKEAMLWSAFWIALALTFNVAIWIVKGHHAAMQFLAGYLLEKSLSVDNLFVFLLIFSYFKVSKTYQHEVLFWGILGALVMRAIFIVVGIELIHRFHWIIYFFGAFLVFTGFKLFFEKDKEIHPEKNFMLRFFKRFMPVTHEYEGGKFFIKRSGKMFATPLFIVLLVVETTDVVFATDSIPAIIAVTRDPFLVYTSNVFAILGLRALYFALSGMMEMFHYLHYGLGAILIFIGVKMLIEHWYAMPIPVALGTIATILTLSIGASILWPKIAKETH
jgi:tellurite resistance protein TerC